MLVHNTIHQAGLKAIQMSISKNTSMVKLLDETISPSDLTGHSVVQVADNFSSRPGVGDYFVLTHTFTFVQNPKFFIPVSHFESNCPLSLSISMVCLQKSLPSLSRVAPRLELEQLGIAYNELTRLLTLIPDSSLGK